MCIYVSIHFYIYIYIYLCLYISVLGFKVVYLNINKIYVQFINRDTFIYRNRNKEIDIDRDV